MGNGRTGGRHQQTVLNLINNKDYVCLLYTSSFRVKMYGYNYDELYDWVEKLKAKLLSHRRIREVTVSSDFSWWKDDYMEFYFNLNKQRMAEEGIGACLLYTSVFH